MGFIKAFSGGIGGAFADAWKDYYLPDTNAAATVGIFHAFKSGTDAGRGSNTKGSDAIITNGSRFVVPEGTALVTLQDGAITAFIAEAGGYEYSSDDPNSKSFLAGDELGATLKNSWERFKFGGIPAAQQRVIYVNLKEIPNNRFGTQSEIYWDDMYLNAQVGCITRGTYSLKIIDPILFVKQFVPQAYIQNDSKPFDFADMENDAGNQLFNEVVGSLSEGFSNYTNDPNKGNRISRIQGDQVGFAQSLSQAVEDNYHWKSDRGLEIVKVALQAIEYDETTKQLLADVQKADALSGSRGNSFMQQAAARGLQGAGENGGGGMGMAFMGVGANAAGSMMNGMQQPANGGVAGGVAGQPQTGQPQATQAQAGQAQAPQAQAGQVAAQDAQAQPAQAASAEDPMEKLSKAKQMLDAGLITQDDYDKLKSQVLGF